jgi:hypothetical protein
VNRKSVPTYISLGGRRVFGLVSAALPLLGLRVDRLADGSSGFPLEFRDRPSRQLPSDRVADRSEGVVVDRNQYDAARKVDDAEPFAVPVAEILREVESPSVTMRRPTSGKMICLSH